MKRIPLVFFLIALGFVAAKLLLPSEEEKQIQSCAESIRASQDSIKKFINQSAIIIDSGKRSSVDQSKLNELAQFNALREKLRNFEKQDFPSDDHAAAELYEVIQKFLATANRLIEDKELFIPSEPLRANVSHQELLKSWKAVPQLSLDCDYSQQRDISVDQIFDVWPLSPDQLKGYCRISRGDKQDYRQLLPLLLPICFHTCI